MSFIHVYKRFEHGYTLPQELFDLIPFYDKQNLLEHAFKDEVFFCKLIYSLEEEVKSSLDFEKLLNLLTYICQRSP